MKKKTIQAVLIIFLILAALLPHALWASEEEKPFGIQLNLSPDRLIPGTPFNLDISFDIAPNHYLYADKITVTPDQNEHLSFSSPIFEKPIEKEDPYVGKILIYKEKTKISMKGSVLPSAPIGLMSHPIRIRFQGCTETRCFIPETRTLTLPISIISAFSKEQVKENSETENSLISKNTTDTKENQFTGLANRFGLFGVIAGAFLWGFLTSLTPCVYPMIPIISASVIRANSSGNLVRSLFLSLTYVIGMSLVYALLGITAAFSGTLFGSYTNHPATRIVTSTIFLLLGFSMLGLFQIQIPSVLSSKLGGGRSKASGLLGVFLTGAVSGAIIGPCVGPILIALLAYIATTGNHLQGFIIMWSFGLGMGLLFLIIGTFSGAASMLPRSGRWMESLKNLLAVFLISFSIYYIKPLLSFEVFSLCLGLFLIGIALFMGTLDFLVRTLSPYQRITRAIGITLLTIGIIHVARFAVSDSPFSESLSSSRKDEAQNASRIPWIKDEATAFAEAKEKGLPLVVDFYADWCASCVLTEKKTFSSEKVISQSHRFIWLKIDCTRSESPGIKSILKKYDIKGLPTILFYSRNGNPIKEETVNDFIGADEFLKLLDRIENAI